MTNQEIKRHIADLNQLIMINMLPYPLGGDEAQLNIWREHHDYYRGDIERLEFLLKCSPPRPNKVRVEELRIWKLNVESRWRGAGHTSSLGQFPSKQVSK